MYHSDLQKTVCILPKEKFKRNERRFKDASSSSKLVVPTKKDPLKITFNYGIKYETYDDRAWLMTSFAQRDRGFRDTGNVSASVSVFYFTHNHINLYTYTVDR